MKTKTAKRIVAILLILMMNTILLNVSFAEGSMPLIGEWVFDYDPETTVLKVETDGSAWFKGKDYRWEDQGAFLKLTDMDGNSINLRYTATEEQKVIYLQTRYKRGKEVEGQGGLIGIWEGIDDGSSFVFTPAGYFLEDSAFSGNFSIDYEAGTFQLTYGDIFADTICYYSITDEILTVEYPWKLQAKG